VWSRLRSAGFTPVHAAARSRVDGKIVTRRYWAGPDPRDEGADAPLPLLPPSPPIHAGERGGPSTPPPKVAAPATVATGPETGDEMRGGRWQQGGNKWQHWGLTTRDFTRPRLESERLALRVYSLPPRRLLSTRKRGVA
jgi:hypothetical protein